MSVWPIIIVVVACLALASPTLRRVWREAREQDIIEAEARRVQAHRELVGADETLIDLPKVPDWWYT